MKTVVDLVTKIKEYFLGKKVIAPVELDASSSTSAYAIGDQLIVGDALYEATAAISIGDALTVGTNIQAADNITDQINSKQNQMQLSAMPAASADYVGKVIIYIGTTTADYISGQSYQCVENSGSYSWVATVSESTATNVSFNNTTSGLSATNVQDAIDEVVSCTGDLSELTTTNKNNLVAAINETDSSAGHALYFTNQNCSAVTGNFCTVSNANITADHVLAEAFFARPENILTNVTWTTSQGSIILNGTCESSTTVNLVLIKKSN